MNDRSHYLKLVEAFVFAAAEAVTEKDVQARLPEGLKAAEILAELQALYAERGVRLTKAGETWAFRTAPELAGALAIQRKVERRLSRAALETLAIVAYHQPVTRAEIEHIRGVALSKGSLDVLLEAGWVKPGKRRRTPGLPLTWITTVEFLQHFQLEKIADLPGIEELRAAGLLDARPAIQAFHAAETEVDPDAAEDAEAAEPLELDESAFVAEDESTEDAVPPGDSPKSVR